MNMIWFLAQMCARFSPQQVVHAAGRGCGCARGRYSAVKSSVAQSTTACAGPAISGGPARRQPARPQGAEALALTWRRTMKASGMRPRLSMTFDRCAELSPAVQPLWNRQPLAIPLSAVTGSSGGLQLISRYRRCSPGTSVTDNAWLISHEDRPKLHRSLRGTHDLEDGSRPIARGRAGAEGRRAKRGAP